MKTFMMLAAALGVASSAAALAKGPAKDAPGQKPDATLAKALNAAVTPPGHTKEKVDRDQGDDHASDRAREVVCSKDTPAAHRSAICDRPPVSPE
jgi:hypothetical protein